MSRYTETEIETLHKVSSGQWLVVVRKTNYTRKGQFTISSEIFYSYYTNDSMAVDDFRSDDKKRYLDGKKRLIYQAKTYGDKEVIRY